MTETKMPALELEPRERATRSKNPDGAHSTARPHRSAPRDLRRIALVVAMGEAPGLGRWRRLGDVVVTGATS